MELTIGIKKIDNINKNGTYDLSLNFTSISFDEVTNITAALQHYKLHCEEQSKIMWQGEPIMRNTETTIPFLGKIGTAIWEKLYEAQPKSTNIP